MRNPAILSLFVLFLLLSSCTKKDSATPPVTPPATTPHPYYFKFTFNGTNYNFNSNFPQYMPFYANEIGGYQDADGALFPSAGLRLSWPLGDTVKESDVMALIGKTLYYNDVAIHPEVSYDELNTAIPAWYSNDTANTSYNVKITNVAFLKNDTSAGNPLRTYVITGTCTAVISQSDSTGIFSAGEFNFIISRRDL